MTLGTLYVESLNIENVVFVTYNFINIFRY